MNAMGLKKDERGKTKKEEKIVEVVLMMVVVNFDGDAGTECKLATSTATSLF